MGVSGLGRDATSVRQRHEAQLRLREKLLYPGRAGARVRL